MYENDKLTVEYGIIFIRMILYNPKLTEHEK